jgi:hypothetical protein
MTKITLILLTGLFFAFPPILPKAHARGCGDSCLSSAECTGNCDYCNGFVCERLNVPPLNCGRSCSSSSDCLGECDSCYNSKCTKKNASPTDCGKPCKTNSECTGSCDSCDGSMCTKQNAKASCDEECVDHSECAKGDCKFCNGFVCETCCNFRAEDCDLTACTISNGQCRDRANDACPVTSKKHSQKPSGKNMTLASKGKSCKSH